MFLFGVLIPSLLMPIRNYFSPFRFHWWWWSCKIFAAI